MHIEEGAFPYADNFLQQITNLMQVLGHDRIRQAFPEPPAAHPHKN